MWRQKYSSLEAYTDKVLEVMHDQANRGQVLRLSEDEAKRMFPNLTVASLGAQRKEKQVVPFQRAYFSTELMASLSTTGRGQEIKKEAPSLPT